MTLETTTFFKELCSEMDIIHFPSSLGGGILRLEEVDFWIFLQNKRNSLGYPLEVFEVGNSFVIHFHVKEEGKDLQFETIPKNKSNFLQLMEDFKHHASF